jgi:peptide-methionine (S)-S-oxide reductase
MVKVLILAGGCFWCMEPPFEALQGQGVISVTSGYSGGTPTKPTYEDVSKGGTGHREVIEVKYDSSKITLEKLLEVFWKTVDPLDSKGQFCDKGEQYTSAIYYSTDEEKKIAEKTMAAVKEKLKNQGPVATALLPAKPFYPAEDYHQDYYKKNPLRYKFYRTSCGRDDRLKKVWGG